ncbi:ribose 5-phosphate isomerase B [candidate division WOR-3 bacterium]|nr:ribose 5-phosphate isomerase B [candidate division WOR-3 bacterium]
MKIHVGADHRGYKTKTRIVKYLLRTGHEVLDHGTGSEAPVDYPDIALAVGQAVARGKVSFGILLCYTGQGMVIAANKVKGVRAALCVEKVCARFARAHNNANVLVMPAGFFEYGPRMRRVIDTFLNTPFEKGRHQRRIDKIRKHEGSASRV